MNIHHIIRSINRELVPVFEEKLRQELATKDREWLVEQIVRLSMDAHALEENDRRQFALAKEQRRAERRARLHDICLSCSVLENFLHAWAGYTREAFIQEDYLLESAPPKGTHLISPEHRTEKGSELLLQAKDILFGLLFGDDSTNTNFIRREREMLTLIIPRHKAGCLDFMKATTELSASGTWQDPESVSNDSHADNVILEVEFGEVEGELIGKGIILSLSLINHLEVNEQILYGRMINIEQSTLIF
jgi:hypothetical protein